MKQICSREHGAVQSRAGDPGNGKRRERRRWAAFFAAGFGIVCMAAGMIQGDLSAVMNKAVNICLECIGIG